nr:unnamed protein product [Callosobruchus analis]
MSYNLTLLNLNIRSLFPSLTTLSAYLTKNEIDIVMLCETWLDASINSDLLNISSYNIIRADRDGRGGGVAVYIKRNYSYKTILSKVSPCLEQLWISIKINKRTYSFAVVYRPPSASVVDCINELDISISTILPVSDSLLIAGDLNINILDKNRPTILLLNLLESYDLKQLVNTPTRISNTSQTLIDVIIVSNPDEINMVDSFDMLGVSDHLAIICEFRFLSHCRRPRFKQFRDFRNFDLQLFYHWESYKQLRNIVNVAVIREKQCYLNYVLKNKAPRQMWSSLRSLEVLRKKDTSVLPAHLSDIDAINKSFIDTMVVEKTEGQRALLNKYAPSNTLSSFYFSAVSEDTVKEYLYKIKSNAIGSDAISVRMLALVEGCLLKYITYIINFCISRNVFPAAWKHAIVLPLPKCYNPCNLSDIRPISILPAFSKVLEMALKCQITHFIEEHDILTSAQSGFRAQHSTTTALLSVENVTVITGSETLSAFEEGLADDDSWVENLSHDDEDTPTEDSSSGEEVTLTCSAAIDQEDELRGYHRSAIDFTLHTILEDSCEGEESEVEQTASRRKERPASATDLEKYFFFGLGDGIATSLNSNRDDALSETSSIYSEGVESLGGMEDVQQNHEADPADLASSRLEKYFLSGFMGFTAERRDSDGSVGSDSEGRPSPEQRRKRLVRARGTGRSHSSSLDNLDNAGNEQTAEPQINSEDSSSSDSDAYDDVTITNFEKSDGQFDTIKRKKGKKHKNAASPADESKNLETTQEVNEEENELDDEDPRNKTPQPEPMPSNLTTNKNQQSRDSGFIGSCDDLLKDQRDNCTPDLPTKTELKIELENIAEERIKMDERVPPLSTPPATSLMRKDSFNNWSSDEETNLMMCKMRQFFKTMVANSQCAPNSKPTTPNLTLRTSPKSLGKSRCKPPQLVYFENELTRLMKTVPGIKDEQVREIVEYLSSEDTWSDSYDSSDYTSSDLEGASTKSALQQQISDSCKQIINKFDNRIDDEGDEGDGGIIDESHGLNKETAFVYQKLMASFEKMATGDSDAVNVSKLPAHGSPPLIAKVMHHIGSRLVALMHEPREQQSQDKHYHKRLQHKISSASSTTTEDDLPELVSQTESRPDAFEDTYNLLPRSRSHDLLDHTHQSGAADASEEREASDCERFSWRGSFESALLATDSRNKLSLLGSEGSASASALAIAAKRRSAGDLLFSHKSLSREQLDRVRSCGSIGGANSEDKLWTRPNRRRSSVPDATSCGSGGSADGEDEDEDMDSRSTLPRSLQSVAAQSTNSLPRLPTNASAAMQKSQSMYQFLPQHVKSARYRPPGLNRITSIPKRAVSAPGLQPTHQRRGRRSQQVASGEFLLGFLLLVTGWLCLFFLDS